MCLAIPGQLVAITGDGELRVGEVDFGGVSRETNLVFVPEAAVGDYVLVHVGFAIARVDEDVARQTLETLAALEALGDEESGDASS
jgi:hydrogenase expression/formation protein HypC